jgi:hypothetical protein
VVDEMSKKNHLHDRHAHRFGWCEYTYLRSRPIDMSRWARRALQQRSQSFASLYLRFMFVSLREGRTRGRELEREQKRMKAQKTESK